MSKLAITNSRKATWFALAVMVLAVGFANFIGVRDILPSIMQDELVYRQDLDRSQTTTFPNVAFSFIFSFATLFGSDFYLAVKATNIILLVLFGLVTFAFLRRRVSAQSAFLGATIMVTMPFTLFTSFLMPEIGYMVFIASGVLALNTALQLRNESHWKWIGLAGGLFAIGQLFKPHGLFVLVALLIYLLVFWRRDARSKIIAAASLIASFVLFRVVFGVLLSGISGLDFLGRYADGIGAGAGGEILPLLAPLLGNFLMNLGQHLAIIFFLTFPFIQRYLGGKTSLSQLSAILLTTIIVVAIFIAAFESYITVIQDDDHLSRLLLRHYEFLLPLFWVSAATEANQKRELTSQRSFSFALASFLSFLLFVAIGLFDGSLWSVSLFSDSAITNALGESFVMWIYVLGGLLVAIWFRREGGELTRLSLVLTLSVFISLTGWYALYQQNSNPLDSDVGAYYILENFSEVQDKNVVFVGTSKALIEAAAFIADKPGAQLENFGAFSTVDIAQRYRGKEVVFVSGSIQIAEGSLSPIWTEGDVRIYYIGD